MGRKVFISVLGTGLYNSCKYFADGFCSTETRFIQHATLEYLDAKNWPSDSKAYILLTEKARKDNWLIEGNKRYNVKTKEELQYKGLHDVLNDAELPFDIEGVSIPDGKDEQEMWQIFETVFRLLDNNDELYLDLTHSFRYLPMLMLVLGNYSKFLKGVTVCSLTYGNYEAMNPSTSEAPIMNLLALSSLQDWTFASADFLRNGNAERLVELSKKEYEPLMRNAETRTDDTKKLKNLVNLMGTFSSDMRTCRGLNIINAKTTDNAKEVISELQTVVVPQLKPVFHKLEESIKSFEGQGSVSNAFEAAKWCFDKQLYQQATTFLEEGVISYFCQRHGIDLDDKGQRELITSAFSITYLGINKDEWIVKSENLPLLEEIVNDELLKNKDLVKSFCLLVDLRNDYNHCGMRKSTLKPTVIQDRILKHIETIIPLLSDDNIVKEKKQPCFLNFSNHPSSLWEESQLEAARQYGDIADMPFPSIDPGASSETVKEMAKSYVHGILKIAKDHDVTVHVMGEMTFVFTVVTQLEEKGIRCVASTTERIVKDNDDGTKTSEFSFVGFREY